LISFNHSNKSKFIKWFGKISIEPLTIPRGYIGIGNVGLNQVLPNGTWIGFCVECMFGSLQVIPIVYDDGYKSDAVNDAIKFDNSTELSEAIDADVSFMIHFHGNDNFPLYLQTCIAINIEGSDVEIVKEFFHGCTNIAAEQRAAFLSVTLSKGWSFNVKGLLFSDDLVFES